MIFNATKVAVFVSEFFVTILFNNKYYLLTGVMLCVSDISVPNGAGASPVGEWDVRFCILYNEYMV